MASNKNMSANNSISSRTHRLNKLIVCGSDDMNTNVHSNTSLNRETLFDAFELLYNECNKDALKKNDRNIFDFAKKYQNVVSETKKQRVNINDFEIKDLIGKGFFGEVNLAVENITRDVYAIKKIPKTSFAQSKEERNIMAINRSDWIPKLQYAFQDVTHLYLVMEYLPGGDLFSLMVRNSTFPEDAIQFYLAEITLALNALHTLGFVHRDCKPGNILLDRLGHLKLTDFGSAISIEKDGQVVSYTPAGTPDYIAPELLQPIHSKRSMKTTYNETCDFWSMGIIAYEMLTETTPFHSQNIHDTYNQILSYIDGTNSEKLQYPHDIEISNDLRDLIDHLVTKMKNRFTYKKIITHKFFQSIDWMNLRQQVPPIIPSLSGELDTSNFEVDIKKSRRSNTFDTSPTSSSMNNTSFSGFDLPFVGFSYVHDDGQSFSFDSSSQEINRLTTQLKNLQKTIDTQMLDIGSLQKNLSEYQKKSAQASSIEKILGITKEEMNALKEKLKEKTVEIAYCRTQIKTLKNSLKIEEEQRAKNDANIADVLNSTYQKWERSKKQSEQNYEKQISEKKSEVLAVQGKLKVCERELESKSVECTMLQETIKSLKERMKSTKNQSDTEINAHARKHRESNVHFEGQLRDLRTRVQTITDAKNMADDEIHRLKMIIEENKQSHKLIADQNNRLSETIANLNGQLNKEINENRSLRDEKLKLTQTILDLQNKVEELSNSVKSNRISSGTSSLYCSLESLSSEVENQLKRDLELAKEGENVQRLRANSLEETVKRLEAAVERVTQQGLSGVEVLLERKNEKLEEKLSSVQEQATIEKQASRTARLDLWKNEKELESVRGEKRRLEYEVKKLQTETDELNRKVKENKIIAQSREERIAELQSEIAERKNELQTERSRWSKIENERNKEKIQIVNQNTKIHKLEIDLDECKSKMSLFEQQKNSLTVENQQLTHKLRKEVEKLDETMEKLIECQQNYETLNKNHETLKSVCSLMEMQLVELEEMYNTQLDQNKEKSVSIDKLYEDIRERDEKLLKLQQEMSDEKTQNKSMKQKSSEMSSEMERLTSALTECRQNMNDLQKELLEKADYLMKSEELIEVQKEEIQSLQRVNHNFDREIVIIKEEHSKLLTELYLSKENYQKLHFEYSSLNENYNDLRKELEQLDGTMSELNKYHTQREIKSEATQAQYKKLIDYLQKRVDELAQKNKKTWAEVLFGANTTSKKENIPPSVNQTPKGPEIVKSNSCQKSQSVKTTKSNTINDRSSKKTDKSTTKSTVNYSNSSKESKEVSKNKSKVSTPESQSSGTHLFERSSHTNSIDATETCLVCKKHFVKDTVYQCKKCNACVHQYCRGSNLKCSSAPETSDSSSNDDKLSLPDIPQQPSYVNDVVKDVVLKEFDMTPSLEILCMHEIEENVLLLGCSSGLKSYNVISKKLIHIANIDNIINMSIVPTFPKSILVSDNGKKLLQCDLRHLQTRANASVCLNTGMDYIELNLPFVKENTPSYDLWRFVKIYDNNEREISEPIAIAATNTQIVILQYDIENKHFKAIRSLDTATPVQAIYYTPFTAIVSSDKFFEIDLNSLISEEFLDLSESNLNHTLDSRPLNTFAINAEEYLMCFKDFCIFTDSFGRRTRKTDLWLKHSPKAFAYRAPILYIFSDEGVQLMHISKSYESDDTEDDGEKQTFIEMKKAQFGTSCGKYGVYALCTDPNYSNGIPKQVIRLDGTKFVCNFAHFDSVETLN